MLQANEGEIKYATRERTPTNEDNVVKYSETFPLFYTAASDGETVIGLTFPTIPGSVAGSEKIIQVERNTQPMDPQDWAFNTDALQLSLLNDNSLGTGEKLHILYKVIMNQ